MHGDRLTTAAAILILACDAAGPARAAGRVQVTVGHAEFAGLEIEDLDVGIAPSGDGAGATVRMSRIRGIAATGPLAGFALDCPALRFEGDAIHCPRGRLRGSLGTLGTQDTAFSATTASDGTLGIRFESFAFAGGRARADLRLDGSRWRLEARLSGLDLEKLPPIARPWMELPDGFAVAGAASGELRAAGRGDAVESAALRTDIARLDFADAAGTLAGEGLTGKLAMELAAAPRGFAVRDGRLEIAGGQAYSDPVFLDFGVHAADLDFAGLLVTGESRFEASAFALDHRDVLRVGGSATLDFAGETLLTDARLAIEAFELGTALPAYVQPFLIATALKDIQGAGRVSGELDVTAGLPTRAALDIAGAVVDSQTGALSVSGLNGRLNWFDDESRSALAGNIDDALFQSRVAWESAGLWGIEIGAVELPFATTGRHFRLLEPRLLPIFDGGLAIETLRVRHAGTEQMYLRFDAELRPISVARLSRALGWPEFSGTLSGRIPGLQLSEGVVTLGGNLEAAVFDGRVVVRDLQLREPLGKFPRLHASIDVENLDLELVTRTFSFGMITGRLSGRVEDLETFDWVPVSFTAAFATPPGDRSRHRISQRAVQNLSSIGGGSGGSVAAALQGGFLKFFDEFGYDRLGLSCRLANDVCAMSGVERAPGGYYIVKGSGIPRIDVIGSQARVAWTRLVRQLATIMESEIVVE